MNLTEAQLKDIEELAGLFLSPEEIAILVDIDENQFLQQIAYKKGNAYTAYFRGKTLSKRDIHINIVKMAKHGSPQAEELAREMIVEQKSAERRAKK
jgi:hypothetical protein